MKRIIILLGVMSTFLSACHEKTVGYLITENASYEPDSLVIPRELDPVEHAIRIKNQSPWISYAMQGYEGTEQIMFSVESVTSTAGEAEARPNDVVRYCFWIDISTRRLYYKQNSEKGNTYVFYRH